MPRVRRRLDSCFRAFALIRLAGVPRPSLAFAPTPCSTRRARSCCATARGPRRWRRSRAPAVRRPARSTTRSARATRVLDGGVGAGRAALSGGVGARPRSGPDPVEAGVGDGALAARVRARAHARTAGCCSACALEDLVDGPAPDLATRQRARGRDRRRRSPAGSAGRPPASAWCWPPSTSPTARSGAGCWAASRRHARSTVPVAAAVRAVLTHDQELPRWRSTTSTNARCPSPRTPSGDMLETLGGPDDRLWPARPLAGGMKLDGGLEPGHARPPRVHPLRDRRRRARPRASGSGSATCRAWRASTASRCCPRATARRCCATCSTSRPAGRSSSTGARSSARLHDALLEDLLDRAEGRPPRGHER